MKEGFLSGSGLPVKRLLGEGTEGKAEGELPTMRRPGCWMWRGFSGPVQHHVVPVMSA